MSNKKPEPILTPTPGNTIFVPAGFVPEKHSIEHYSVYSSFFEMIGITTTIIGILVFIIVGACKLKDTFDRIGLLEIAVKNTTVDIADLKKELELQRRRYFGLQSDLEVLISKQKGKK